MPGLRGGNSLLWSGTSSLLTSRWYGAIVYQMFD
jgi:hypothetical protein